MPLDINFIRTQGNLVREGLLKKKNDPKLVDKFLKLDDEWKIKNTAIDQLNAERKQLSKELATQKSDSTLKKADILKESVAKLEKEFTILSAKRDELLERFPNLPSADAPVSEGESGNLVVREVGEKPMFDFSPKDYLTLGENLGIINVKKAAEVSGSRFGYLLGDAALLEIALIQFSFRLLVKHGFIPVIPPVMIKPEMYAGMGRLAHDQKEERYFLEKDNLYLIGSAEHTLGPLQGNEILEEKDLPRRYVGFSTCFRREAGSYGKDTKGILRVHQFDKVEMFVFAHPEHSRTEHEQLLAIQEELWQALKIPYRVVEISTGDMGWTDAKQYDVEAWLPGQNVYREMGSCSNTTDFQARGINAKYKTKNGEKNFVHMLNATGLAIGRTIIAIMENFQTKEGTIVIPQALQEFMSKKEIS